MTINHSDPNTTTARNHRLRQIAVFVAGVSLAASVSIVLSSRPAAAGVAPSAVKSEIVAAINAERAQRGMGQVFVDGGTTAQDSAVAYLNSGDAHPDGYDWVVSGDQITREISVNLSGGSRDAVRAWMGSTGHRVAVLDRSATAVRIGVACREDGRMFVVAQILATFGESGPQPAATPVASSTGGTGCPLPSTSTTTSPTTTTTQATTNSSGPSGTNEAMCFVNELFTRGAGRPPTIREASSWTSTAVSSGTAVAGTAFASSDPALSRIVSDVYLVALSRKPEAGGLAFWVSSLRRSGSSAEVSALVFSSPESYGLGGGTDAGYVERLYRLVLSRKSDPNGLAFWAARVGQVGRKAVASQMLDSAELRSKRVLAAYVAVLGRVPDGNEASGGLWVLATTGEVGLNAYLFGSAQFLSVVRASCPK